MPHLSESSRQITGCNTGDMMSSSRDHHAPLCHLLFAPPSPICNTKSSEREKDYTLLHTLICRFTPFCVTVNVHVQWGWFCGCLQLMYTVYLFIYKPHTSHQETPHSQTEFKGIVHTKIPNTYFSSRLESYLSIGIVLVWDFIFENIIRRDFLRLPFNMTQNNPQTGLWAASRRNYFNSTNRITEQKE